MHPLDVREGLNGIQGHHHLYGRAVGVSNDSARTHEGVVAIHLRYHQRHIVVHAEGARIVDHDGTVAGNRLGKLLRGTGSGRRKGYVNSLEIVIVLQLLDYNLFTPEGISTTCTSRGTEQQQFVDREIPLVQNSQELLSDGAAGAHNSDFHLLSFLIYIPKSGLPLFSKKVVQIYNYFNEIISKRNNYILLAVF